MIPTLPLLSPSSSSVTSLAVVIMMASMPPANITRFVLEETSNTLEFIEIGGAKMPTTLRKVGLDGVLGKADS